MVYKLYQPRRIQLFNKQRVWGGSALIGLGLFMLMGYMNAQPNASGGAVLMALLITVVLPVGAGSALLYSDFKTRSRLKDKKQNLALSTLENEVLKFAKNQGNKLTTLEVAMKYNLPEPKAEAVLDGLALKKMADYQVTDDGLIVYHFGGFDALDNKSQSRGLLE